MGIMIKVPLSNQVTCEGCGAVIGELVRVNGNIWLRVGGCELKYYHGRCDKCKRLIHYDSNKYIPAYPIQYP